ncbi:MAG: redoxin domain-containing protein [Myxococcota bacterium]|nr:redoxin domain-containing protein [Myxococcota bacterium]
MLIMLILGCSATEKELTESQIENEVGSSVETEASSEPTTEPTGEPSEEQTDDSNPSSSPSTEPSSEEGGYIITGTVTWTLTFDEEAQAAGYSTCSYNRTYEGSQFLDMNYLCADCDVLTRGIATMQYGLDCHGQISQDNEAERTELWGFGSESFHRGGRDQFVMGALSELDDPQPDTDIPLAWSSEYEVNEGGTMLLEATGSFQYVWDTSLSLEDPWETRTDPYTCGWPQNDPGNLPLDYELGIGKTFPNVQLRDQCGERLSLWDLYGHWLILDTTQSDCGPCRSMAADSEEALIAMREEGIDVMMVSFLGNGLSYPFETPSETTFNSWVETYGLMDPVLYDQGFAYALFPKFVEDYSGEGFGYPTWLVVNPQMELVHGNVGYSSWDNIRQVILDNQ